MVGEVEVAEINLEKMCSRCYEGTLAKRVCMK